MRLGGRGGRGRLRRSRPRSSPPVSDDPGVVHLHGLGVNPRDGARYAATHSGLFVIREGAASRVADRYQDTMGFTVVGPDHFLGSGHGEQRRESLHPPVDGDVVDLDAALGEQLFGVAVGQPKRSYQRTASTMTSGGKQKPVNAERAWGAGQGRRVLMAAVCLLRALPTDVTVPARGTCAR